MDDSPTRIPLEQPALTIGYAVGMAALGAVLVGTAVFANQGWIVGAIGVIGPTRINYARIIPLVDYTSRVISRLIG